MVDISQARRTTGGMPTESTPYIMLKNLNVLINHRRFCVMDNYCLERLFYAWVETQRTGKGTGGSSGNNPDRIMRWSRVVRFKSV